MPDSDRPHVAQHASGPLGRRACTFTCAALPIVLNLISTFGCAYTVFAVIRSARWHRGENLASLALLVVGLPTLFAQVVVFLPVTQLCARKLTAHATGFRTHWLRFFAGLLPAVTLTAIVTGVVITEMNAKRQ
jgi:hypothetical protein